MSHAAIMKSSGPGYGKPAADNPLERRYAAISVALWLFMAVATALFLLFIAAYIMRMEAADWSPLAMPWQLWLSTSILVIASVFLQLAVAAAHVRQMERAHTLLMVAGFWSIAFLGAQFWGWQALQAIHVTANGNPAGSFFYLLTAMHGLHVAGGLVGWSMAAAGSWRQEPRRLAWRIRLCARYWHFLLAVWLLLFAALGWLTPDLVRMVCGTR
ncbi:Alternative cytochrome c oxidase polypeptide CoxO [Collimonas arenae]|uniref:Alternative cytochrome c oxidase polypeptide CoxO n=1 Tax=Collimonas arenae TaxID=279058 RepID=A0A0A1FEK0_9BURK|nr:cytochrome c oxidase subunit 3 [Collimonas arenae]AIY42220.1 Alternative cytochrome c oxidase polypeptide CoxO [Collimonas arenae]